jgi:Periplasmic binding proteins and sugar binding domain of LacI family
VLSSCGRRNGDARRADGSALLRISPDSGDVHQAVVRHERDGEVHNHQHRHRLNRLAQVQDPQVGQPQDEHDRDCHPEEQPARRGADPGDDRPGHTRDQHADDGQLGVVGELEVDVALVRNESARKLRAGRSRTIGLVVLDVAKPFFTDVARGVEDEANKAGLAVILCNSDDQERKENRYLDVLEEHRVQGGLITPVVGASTRLASLQLRGTPVVLVDSS